MSTTRPPSYDERYAAPVEASRRGAHRARPNPVASVVPVIAGVAVVVLVVVGAFVLLQRNNGSSGDNPPAAAPTATSGAGASATPSATASTAPSSSPTAGAGAEADKSIELRVLSSVSVSGLAKTNADLLEEKGWTVGEVGNSNQRDLSVSRVYYAEADQKATAQAIVADLGFGETKKSVGNAGDGITVVLGQDAES
jgi:hypothetical protein